MGARKGQQDGLESRLLKEATGVALGKLLPANKPDYQPLGALNLSPEEDKDASDLGTCRLISSGDLDSYIKLFFSSRKDPSLTNLPVLSFGLSSFQSDGRESLSSTPLVDVDVSSVIINIPETTDRFVIGPFGFGKKRVITPYEAVALIFNKTSRARVRYQGTSSKPQPGRGHFAVSIELVVPQDLADAFMERAESSPDDVWKILEGLFPGTYEVEHNDRFGTGFAYGVMRTGKMHYLNGTEEALKKAGFELGKQYISGIKFADARDARGFRLKGNVALLSENSLLRSVLEGVSKSERANLDLLPQLGSGEMIRRANLEKELTYMPS